MKSQRLAMSLLVRDEAALIEHNIAFHSRLGVDCFVVTDNGSVDGTRDILDRLRRQYPVHIIDEPEPTMKQDEWVSRMARVASAQLGAAWIINGDADEFWLPASGSLASVIPRDAAVLRCRRANMVATRDQVDAPGFAFHRNTLRVANPYSNAPFQNPPWTLTRTPFVLTAVGPKVMCRLDGLRAVTYGNHDAIHDGPALDCHDVSIYHYPVRTFEEFLSKVINHGVSLENNPSIPSHIGWHVRRWYALYQQGLIEEEYRRLLLDPAEAESLLQSGVLVRDHAIARIFASPAIP